MKKVSIVGSGRVGATTAYLLALKGIADVCITDVIGDLAHGVALDIMESLPLEGSDSRVVGGGYYNEMAGSDVVVVTAGAPRAEGMSREDLLKTNAEIVSGIAAKIKRYAPKSIVIVVTNPLDAMAYLMMRKTGFDRRRVIGMAGALDSSRFAAFIAGELKASVKDVEAMVLGRHGDTMVPMLSGTTVRGRQVSEMMDGKKLDGIIARAKEGGAEIIKLEKSSAYYAPASAITKMVDAILNDRKKVVPCSVYLEGEYGFNGIFLGVPVVLGSNGAEKIVEMSLSRDEKKALEDSAKGASGLISKLDTLS